MDELEKKLAVEAHAKWVEAERAGRPGCTYTFVGEGLGVPGLPHEVTLAEAEALGVTQILQGALENGNYQAEGTSRHTLSKVQYGKDQGAPVSATHKPAPTKKGEE